MFASNKEKNETEDRVKERKKERRRREGRRQGGKVLVERKSRPTRQKQREEVQEVGKCVRARLFRSSFEYLHESRPVTFLPAHHDLPAGSAHLLPAVVYTHITTVATVSVHLRRFFLPTSSLSVLQSQVSCGFPSAFMIFFMNCYKIVMVPPSAGSAPEGPVCRLQPISVGSLSVPVEGEQKCEAERLQVNSDCCV